ncbi:MAG: hypothetical protein HZB55_12925 [Deltaproteobacteria bacterium]|nr:hypothetical protein [Deltaproteobacteria bacterium]
MLVYLDGDNDLGDAALADLAEMEAVGSTAAVDVLVQLDLPNGVPAKRYRVVKGGRRELADLGEVDMAKPGTLTAFLKWGAAAAPARRTALVVWNHGNGWDQGDGPSPAAQRRLPSILRDDDNQSPFLANYRVRGAIEAAGVALDLLGLDASIMGTLEAQYELRTVAPVLVTSQEVGETHGWDYTAILGGLTSKPEMGAEELSQLIVDAYRDFFENVFYPDPAHAGYDRRHSISALRTAPLGDLGQAVGGLARELGRLLGDPATRDATGTAIAVARRNVQAIDRYSQPYVYVDLFDLDRLLEPLSPTNIRPLIQAATIAEYHGDGRPNAHGVSIVFFQRPEAEAVGTFDTNYHDYDPQTGTGNKGEFLNAFGWDELLSAYYAWQGGGAAAREGRQAP